MAVFDKQKMIDSLPASAKAAKEKLLDALQRLWTAAQDFNESYERQTVLPKTEKHSLSRKFIGVKDKLFPPKMTKDISYSVRNVFTAAMTYSQADFADEYSALDEVFFENVLYNFWNNFKTNTQEYKNRVKSMTTSALEAARRIDAFIENDLPGLTQLALDEEKQRQVIYNKQKKDREEADANFQAAKAPFVENGVAAWAFLKHTPVLTRALGRSSKFKEALIKSINVTSDEIIALEEFLVSRLYLQSDSEDEVRYEYERVYDRIDAYHPRARETLLTFSRMKIVDVLKDMAEALRTLQAKTQKETDKRAEAPADAPMGKIPFAEENPKAPQELDTEAEKRLYHRIYRHVNENEPWENDTSTSIRDMMSKGYYKSVFKEPKQDVVYRGMRVSEEWMRNSLKLSNVDPLPKKGTTTAAFTLTPKRGDSISWTTSVQKAREFAKPDYDKPFRVVLHARIQDNPDKFIDMKNGLYNLQSIRNYKHEKETIGMGDVRVFQIDWENKQK